MGVINQRQWSLFNKGFSVGKKHDKKIKKAIEANFSDLLAEEGILDGDKKTSSEYRKKVQEEFKISKFRFGENKQQVGMGDGGEKEGDTLAQEASEGDQKEGAGRGEGAGNLPGEDWFEKNIDIEKIKKVLFEKMGLPAFREVNSKDVIKSTSSIYRDVRKTGIQSNIDKRRTIKNSIKRNGNVSPAITKEDLRYKTHTNVPQKKNQAVLLFGMDTSGSMGKWEKYMARSFYFWAKQFLETKYQGVEVVFIAHHTEAKVVKEEEFFHKGESGGTICSSAYREMLRLIKTKYDPSEYNIFAFHISDGDNLTSDNRRSLKMINEIMECGFFHYLEVNAYNRSSTMVETMKGLFELPRFKHMVMKEKKDVYEALLRMFPKSNQADNEKVKS